MHKLVVLFALFGVAVANPSWWGSPLAYSNALLAPSAVSHQSRVDLVSNPILAHASPVLAHSALAYGAPLALPPHHPATVLSPHGVPLDTIEVVAARAAHLQAKALAGHGLHYLKKRSLYGSPLIGAPLAYSNLLAANPWALQGPALVAPHHGLALARHQPATILSPHGVPLDTIDVAVARAQHLQAKALAGSYGLHGW